MFRVNIKKCNESVHLQKQRKQTQDERLYHTMIIKVRPMTMRLLKKHKRVVGGIGKIRVHQIISLGWD